MAKQDEVDGPWPLPDGWSWTRIDRIAAVNPSTNFETLDLASEIPFVPMAAVAEESGKIDLSARRPLRDVAKGYVRFMEGDVIFAKITPCMENGKVAPVVGLPGGYAAGSTEFHVFRPVAVDQKYLWYWLVNRGFRGQAQRNMSGSAGQLRVPADWLRDAPFPLAPLAEQTRIADRVNALFAEIAEGEAALAEARKGLDIFYRALLKAAVTGELTKDWRAANPASETGSDLLARIADKRITDGAAKGRSRRGGDPKPLDAVGLPEIPKTWTWATLETLVVSGPTNGYSPKKSADGSGTLALKLTATTKGCIDLSARAIKALSETIAAESDLFLKPGDLLFQRGNTIEYVGIAAVYDGPSNKYVYPDLMIRVRTAFPILTEWIWRAANSPIGRKYMSANATGTAGTMPKISGEILRNFPVPLPPIAEATEILRRVTDALAASDDALTALDAEAADAARLKQSILKAAFEGRLVPQDATDEPASALLVRLVADRSEDPAKRGRAKSARPKDLAS
ncbi:restriction endonuclease subunit S [Bradyrhizobium commune]|uniref:Restriction endonuclease subunit S n=1 Tax=Bradyrhizobium commune TaxID=83627 RepID=A0A7S9H033_9BRAD|nr:restriction endonuclease subunit S [Bradyrhizobium commune]QPF92188.1 restriction endonuclease subunit S [Bradyrhizobium commune]